MTHDWMLVETLGTEPAVVAKGNRSKDLVPISTFLRRDPNLMVIQNAIAETVRAGQSLAIITPKNDRVIRTEVVQMSDGRIHGVHVWVGPPDVDPPDRPIPGPLKWDLTTWIATDTPESLVNSGLDPETASPQGRPMAEGLRTPDHDAGDIPCAPLPVAPEPDKTFCSTWDVVDYRGDTITVGFVARTLLEEQDDGTDHLICRGMNWRGDREGRVVPVDDLAQGILNGLAQSGTHRALFGTDDWTLLKWLEAPAPFFEWSTTEAGLSYIHPDDAFKVARMTLEFGGDVTSGILRLRDVNGGWVPVHVTLNRVELEPGEYAGLASIRLPTEAELAAAGLDDAGDASPRKPARRSRTRKGKPARS